MPVGSAVPHHTTFYTSSIPYQTLAIPHQILIEPYLTLASRRCVAAACLFPAYSVVASLAYALHCQVDVAIQADAKKCAGELLSRIKAAGADCLSTADARLAEMKAKQTAWEAELDGYTSGYVFRPISAAAREAMVGGPTVIAIHCRQTAGGQYIDAGIVDLAER